MFLKLPVSRVYVNIAFVDNVSVCNDPESQKIIDVTIQLNRGKTIKLTDVSEIEKVLNYLDQVDVSR